MKENYDLVAIGEIAIDAFIRLRDAEQISNHGTQELCVRFGDKIPYESVTEVPAVANAGNASVAAARLGLKSALVANMGEDRNGELCLNSLKKDGVSTEFIGIQKDKDTNYHYVLWFEHERTILQKHSDFVYKLPDIGTPKWIYLTSLGEKSIEYHNEIIEYLKNHPKVKLAFQPGIFQIKMGVEMLKGIYEHTEIFFCNLEEAQTILGLQNKDALTLSKGIQALGPKMVSISDGGNGAYLYCNNELWFIPIYPDIIPPLERTGAGDAFSSTITAALALGKSPQEAFAWGPINSMSVCQEIGAQKGLLSRAKLEEYLAKAPAEYKAKKVS